MNIQYSAIFTAIPPSGSLDPFTKPYRSYLWHGWPYVSCS